MGFPGLQITIAFVFPVIFFSISEMGGSANPSSIDEDTKEEGSDDKKKEDESKEEDDSEDEFDQMSSKKTFFKTSKTAFKETWLTTGCN